MVIPTPLRLADLSEPTRSAISFSGDRLRLRSRIAIMDAGKARLARLEADPYFAPKLREVRVTTREAREAIDELIQGAKKAKNRTVELHVIVLQKLVQAMESLDRDMSLIRTRLDSIEKAVNPSK